MSLIRTWSYFYYRNNNAVLRNIALLGNLFFKYIAKAPSFFEHLHCLTALLRWGCKTSLSWARLKDSFLPSRCQIPWKPAIWTNPNCTAKPEGLVESQHWSFSLSSLFLKKTEEWLVTIDCNVYQFLRLSSWALNLFYCAHLLLLN